jgi:hypothetical protein
LNVILKNKEKDPSDPKAFRPITLLPEFGKIAERLIRDRLIEEAGPENLYLGNQYGFTPGKSTVGAIENLLHHIQNPYKYTVVIFIDICAAFDSVWWPSVVKELKYLNISPNVINLIKSYFDNRQVNYSAHNTCVSKLATKGCPQGSVLGPTMWNLVMNGLLRKEFPDQCQIIAYADDIAISVPGNNRKEIEDQSKKCLEIVEQWASENKLELSTTKSEYVVFGQTINRNPTCKIYGRQIKRTNAFKYLGIILDHKLTFQPHIAYVTGKVKKIFNAIRRLCRSTFGLKSIQNIYEGVTIPIVTYGCEIWGHRVSLARFERKLNETQRACLLALCHSFPTVSCDALCVVTGLPPLKYICWEHIAIKKWGKGQEATYFNVDIEADSNVKRTILKKQLRSETIREWGLDWINSTKGRQTREIFPTIERRLKLEIKYNSQTTQILTGHGNFNHYLQSINKRESPNCSCGEIDTARHRVMTCIYYEKERINIQNAMETKVISYDEIVTFGLEKMPKYIEKFAVRKPINDENIQT